MNENILKTFNEINQLLPVNPAEYKMTVEDINNFRNIMNRGQTTSDQLCEPYTLSLFLKDKNMQLLKNGKPFDFNNIILAGDTRTNKNKVGIWWGWGVKQYPIILDYLYKGEVKKAKSKAIKKKGIDFVGGIQIIIFLGYLVKNGFSFSFIDSSN